MGRTTFLLLLCFILAQADKQVVGLIALPIQESFSLSNTQLGFLQGGAFAIAFALGGLPISRLIDTGHRIRLAACCVGVWSIATILCGVATSFAFLLLFRAATAVAEAGLPPAAFSIFSQQEDSRRVAKATGIFMLAPFVGAGLMFALGGWLLSASGSRLAVPWGEYEPWRIIFVAVGVPGLILVPLLLLMGKEPRRDPAAKAKGTAQTYRIVVRHIFVERPFLRNYYLGLCCVYLGMASLLAWYPALLVRQTGVDPGTAGIGAGLTYLAGGVLGTLAATFHSSTRKALTPATLVRTFLAISIALAPILILLPSIETLPVSLVGYGLFALLSAGVIAVMPVPIQLGLAEHMRGRGIAILSLLMSALAGTIGPLSVGLIMDLTGRSLAAALTFVLLASSLLTIFFFLRAVAHAAQDVSINRREFVDDSLVAVRLMGTQPSEAT